MFKTVVDAALSSAIHFADRHERRIALVGAIWFVISIAAWMPQIPIPKVPYITDRDSWIASAVWNTAWWAILHPMLDRRRTEMRAAQSDNDPSSQNDALD
ncbi:MAG: hypothetical protein ABJN35_11285 [Erythrobacter sp.]